MAIYTQYGRYLKAKMFKELLETTGDTYMVLGLGNPFWDKFDSASNDLDKNQKMPNAPYDVSITESSTSFSDENCHVAFIEHNIESGASSYTVTKDPDNEFSNKLKYLLPKIPGVWSLPDENEEQSPVLLTYKTNNGSDSDIEENITQHEYYKYFIQNIDNNFEVFKCAGTTNNESVGTIDVPTDPDKRQYFAELLLRGTAIQKSKITPYKHPCNLLGAVRCEIFFVKDVGTDSDNFVNDGRVFWYGDRYWAIVTPSDDLEKDVQVSDSQDDKNNIYPHHLYIKAQIEPGTLSNMQLLSNNLVARQFAVYSKPRLDLSLSEYIPNRKIPTANAYIDVKGPNAYRFDEGKYIFNFGQYNDEELRTIRNKILEDLKTAFNDATSPEHTSIITMLENVSTTAFGSALPIDDITADNESVQKFLEKMADNYILNFVPPYNTKGDQTGDDSVDLSNTYGTIGTKFNFILHDYLHGHIRTEHDMENIGYIIGF